MLFAGVLSLLALSLISNFVVIAQVFLSPFYRINGQSMCPSLQPEDAVIITPVDAHEISVGDIVTFKHPDEPQTEIVHRIVAFMEEGDFVYAQTKGDGNAEPDPYLIPLNSINGKVRVRIPMGGVFLSYLRSPHGFIACIVCPLFLVVLYLVSRWYLEKSDPDRNLLARELLPGPWRCDPAQPAS